MVEQKENNERELSVIIPVHNEENNILSLTDEICKALDDLVNYEIIYVDDGSTDETRAKIIQLTSRLGNIRLVEHDIRGGQSAALYNGVVAAKGSIIATIDGDGQNDPADIPILLNIFHSHLYDNPVLMIVGWRKGRKDTILKRASSMVANFIRSRILGDAVPDTGCGLKVFSRSDFLRFPAFKNMHRFLPALAIRSGGVVISEVVNHRERKAGISKYGTFDRLWVGIADLCGVAWLLRRKFPDINPRQNKSDN
tara:strand:+ start:3435 stop:4196 length:762 start_codon:yes stop_codon:yes gene_type:complete